MAGIWRPAGNDRRLVSVGPTQLVFLGDALVGFRDALDAVGQPVIVLDRQRTDDLVFAARGRVAESRLVIDVLPGEMLVLHAFSGRSGAAAISGPGSSATARRKAGRSPFVMMRIRWS